MMRRRHTALAVVGGLILSGLAACGSAPEKSVVEVPRQAATIQQAVDEVKPSGLVLVAPGTYRESVTIKKPGVTLRGLDRNKVVIDGEGIRPHGVVGIADGIRVQNLTVRNNTFYGVLLTGLHDKNGPRANPDQQHSGNESYEKFDPSDFPPLQRFAIDHVTAVNNGLYGIYAFNSQHGVIADNYASGSADSGIYVGQCRNCDILVTGNVAERNAVGFENANASAPLVIAGNRFSNNRVGMTLLSDYQEVFIPQAGNTVVGNLISDNNARATPEQADGGFGIGIGVGGGTDNTFLRNLISGNRRAGIVLSNTNDLPTQGNRWRQNSYSGNRVDVANTSTAVTPAESNCGEPGLTSLPAGLAAVFANCSAGSPLPAAAAESLAVLATAPPGISFLEVAHPKDQPQLTSLRTRPGRLPARVTMPRLGLVRLPEPTLLAGLISAR